MLNREKTKKMTRLCSFTIFNLYSEEIFTKVLENEEGGIRVKGIPLNSLRYADDTVLLAENMSDFQNMLNNDHIQ